MPHSKKSSNKQTPSVAHPAPKKSSPKRWLLTGFWLAVIIAGLWALMHYSAPPSKLEPYDKFKKTSAQAEETTVEAKKDAAPADKSDAVSLPPAPDPSELIQQVAQTPPAPKGLSRETLENIAKGMQLTEQGKPNEGDTFFQKAAELSPNSPEVFSIWGAALRMQKKYKAANKKFARAVELAPKDDEITFNWGISRLEEENAPEAIKLFAKTVELNPNHYLAYNYLGKSYGRKKLYDEEIASYQKAVSINPDFAQAYFNLGVVLSIQKKFEEAAPNFEKAIALDKQFEKPFVVQMLTALGRYNPSAKNQQTAKAEEPAKEEKPEAVQEEAKAPTPEETKAAEKPEDSAAVEKASLEAKKSEGSDHKMEGSKAVKETTNFKGKVLINGEPPGRPTVVFLETKSKLRVPDQKMLEVSVKQSDLAFFPQNTVIPVGSTVSFENHDLEVHNIFSKSQGNQFNLGAMAGGSKKSMRFDQAGPVVLRCNLHKDMVGTIFVVPNGYYTQPNAKGEFSFENVKSVGYLGQVWSPRLIPAEIGANIKSLDLKGVDVTEDFIIESASQPGEIHDMVDPTDYAAIVDEIEKETFQAIEDWKAGKKFISRKRMLMALTKHYDGGGLKGAIAKSFSEKRSLSLEKSLDDIRKQISGIKVSDDPVTEESLKGQAKRAITKFRTNVSELMARLNPDAPTDKAQ